MPKPDEIMPELEGVFARLAEAEAEILRLRASRSEVIEECAKIADYGVERAHRDWGVSDKADAAQDMASELAEAIRSLKEPPHVGHFRRARTELARLKGDSHAA